MGMLKELKYWGRIGRLCVGSRSPPATGAIALGSLDCGLYREIKSGLRFITTFACAGKGGGKQPAREVAEVRAMRVFACVRSYVRTHGTPSKRPADGVAEPAASRPSMRCAAQSSWMPPGITEAEGTHPRSTSRATLHIKHYIIRTLCI